jgi:hypothetical protein
LTPGNAGQCAKFPVRPALTADIAVNAGHWAEPRGRPALTGVRAAPSMPPFAEPARAAVVTSRRSPSPPAAPIVGAQRQRELEHALRTGGHVPLRFRTVGVFTAGGVALAAMTVVLVIAET